MKYSLSYFGIVKADLIEAREWYKNQKAGLEKEFEREVKQSISRLQKNPLGYEIKYQNIRTAFTDVFPFAILINRQEKLSLLQSFVKPVTLLSE